MSWFRPIKNIAVDIAIDIAFTAIANAITPYNKALFSQMIDILDDQNIDHDKRIDTVKKLFKRIRDGETVPQAGTRDNLGL